MKKTLIALTAAASIFGGIAAARADDTPAGSQSAKLTVDANLQEGCSVNFGGGDAKVSFGTVSALNKEMVQHSSFKVSCSALKGQKVGYKALPVKLNPGTGRNSTAQARFLDNGDTDSATLPFQVFQGNVGNSSGGKVWGDGSVAGTFDAYPVDVSSTATSGGSKDYDFTVILLSKPDMTNNTAGYYQSAMTATVDYANAAAQ